MTFDQWADHLFRNYKDDPGYMSNMDAIKSGNLRNAWNAARDEAAKIVWDYARGKSDKHINEIVEDIQKL